MVVTLDQVCMGVWSRVIGIDVGGPLCRRLRDFGMVPGTWVRRRYCSPGGDVVAVELRGSVLALRKADLRRIRVCV